MRVLGWFLIVGSVLLTAACGGGGNDSGTTASSVTAVSVSCSPTMIDSSGTSTCSAVVSGTGDYSPSVTWAASAGSITSAGLFAAPPVSSIMSVTVTATSTQDASRSGSATVTVNPTTVAHNVLPLVVDGGPSELGSSYVDGLFASVRVCAPGSTTQCQTIDHVLVDTGSTGLRLLSSAGGGQLSLSLPAQNAPDGNPLVECTQFLDGFTWGPIVSADIYLGGEVASSVPIQVIAPADAPAIPNSCANTGGTNENTLSLLGTNGILGVGVFLQDCGEGCAQQLYNLYYSCPSTGCVETLVPTVSQVQNPVALFANDNNGVIVQLPAIPSTGQAAVNGSLVFGIGTESNNDLGDAVVYTTNAIGNFTATYNGVSYASSFIDSGSNGLYFLTSAVSGLPLCVGISGFYCPTIETAFTVTNTGNNSASGAVTFNIANARTLANSGNMAFDNLGGTFASGFDYGLPFFFGRNVYVGIENQNTPGGVGPYWAY